MLLVEKENPSNVRLCYYKEVVTDSLENVNFNEIKHGWCGTCKQGARKNCELKDELYKIKV